MYTPEINLAQLAPNCDEVYLLARQAHYLYAYRDVTIGNALTIVDFEAKRPTRRQTPHDDPEMRALDPQTPAAKYLEPALEVLDSTDKALSDIWKKVEEHTTSGEHRTCRVMGFVVLNLLYAPAEPLAVNSTAPLALEGRHAVGVIKRF